MGTEYELKFNTTAETLTAVRETLGGDWARFEMRTTYYDTQDKALSSRKWTLRRRLENGESICTLKTPAELGRREHEVACDTVEGAIPKLCKLGAPEALLALTAGGVQPVCGAAFTRYARRLELPGGAVEVALDSGELFGGEKSQPLCELEVELKAGEPAIAQYYALELAAQFPLLPETKSKFKRALALAR